MDSFLLRVNDLALPIVNKGEKETRGVVENVCEQKSDTPCLEVIGGFKDFPHGESDLETGSLFLAFVHQTGTSHQH